MEFEKNFANNAQDILNNIVEEKLKVTITHIISYLNSKDFKTYFNNN